MKGGTDETAQEAHLLGLFRACKPEDKLLLMETARAFADRNDKPSHIEIAERLRSRPRATPAPSKGKKERPH
jgi:hypothetical protein